MTVFAFWYFAISIVVFVQQIIIWRLVKKLEEKDENEDVEEKNKNK